MSNDIHINLGILYIYLEELCAVQLYRACRNHCKYGIRMYCHINNADKHLDRN